MTVTEISTAPDIYFDPRYGQVCELIEGGAAGTFDYVCGEGRIVHQFIRRRIQPDVDGATWYDLITPYGYGGPLILSCTGDRDALVRGFEEAFSVYCRKERIVSEFIRFHPLLENALDFKSVYDVIYCRHTVATNLGDYEDPFLSEFSKSCRKSVRRGLNQGITYEIVEKPDSLDGFLPIYYETMRRNRAERFYFFDKAYFDRCLELFRENIVLVNAVYEGKVISAEMYFVWGPYIHSHLAGTLDACLDLSPDYVIMYGIMEWGKKNGYRYIHTGGGTSNDPEDPLYLFKKKFGKNTDFDFYVGKRIWDQDIYDRLCDRLGRDETGFFPAYRRR